MKRLWRRMGAVVAVFVTGGLLFSFSGIYNVGATEKHWAPVAWFLQMAMERSVELHARNINPPSLAEPSLILRGAGHYEGGCAPCHGAPGRPRNPIPLQMMPAPPHLASVDEWSDAELFWIVKHGIRYAGMPAWVAPERDDEVWAVVAFLRRINDLSALEYRRLAFGEVAEIVPSAPDDPRLLALAGPIGGAIAACARCHGLDGDGRGVGAFPRLSIQSEAYLYAALKAYSIGGRPSGIMQPVAVGLSDAEMRALAVYYAEISQDDVVQAPESVDPEMLRLGAEIAQYGAHEGDIPACNTCHGPARDPLYPALAGQYADYTALQLKLFKAGVRGGPNGVVMASIARLLTEEQIEAVALYYSTLQPDVTPPAPQAGVAPLPAEPR